jgi:hypothetical protein
MPRQIRDKQKGHRKTHTQRHARAGVCSPCHALQSTETHRRQRSLCGSSWRRQRRRCLRCTQARPCGHAAAAGCSRVRHSRQKLLLLLLLVTRLRGRDGAPLAPPLLLLSLLLRGQVQVLPLLRAHRRGPAGSAHAATCPSRRTHLPAALQPTAARTKKHFLPFLKLS